MAAQFVFIKSKEYKVVNWIDGAVYVSTFSAAGRETPVKSAVTIAKVMAALVDKAHAEALAIDALLHGDHYTYVKPHATSIVFKTDGRRVWWWSFNRGVWFPDANVCPEVVHNHVSSGSGEYVTNPEK